MGRCPITPAGPPAPPSLRGKATHCIRVSNQKRGKKRMAFKQLKSEDIGEVIFVSAKELRKSLNISRSTLYHHIKNDKIDAYRYRHRTYFHPDDAAQYEKLYRSKLLG
jgi:hypothetical protein